MTLRSFARLDAIAGRRVPAGAPGPVTVRLDALVAQCDGRPRSDVRDAKGHDHDAKGRFASKGGGAGGSAEGAALAKKPRKESKLKQLARAVRGANGREFAARGTEHHGEAKGKLEAAEKALEAEHQGVAKPPGTKRTPKPRRTVEEWVQRSGGALPGEPISKRKMGGVSISHARNKDLERWLRGETDYIKQSGLPWNAANRSAVRAELNTRGRAWEMHKQEHQRQQTATEREKYRAERKVEKAREQEESKRWHEERRAKEKAETAERNELEKKHPQIKVARKAAEAGWGSPQHAELWKKHRELVEQAKAGTLPAKSRGKPTEQPYRDTGKARDQKTGEELATYQGANPGGSISKEELDRQRAAENPKEAARQQAARQRRTSSTATPMGTYTEEDLRKRDQQIKAAQAREAQERRQSEQKDQANRELKDFRLSGSDRPADVAAAGGQKDLFSASGKQRAPATTGGKLTAPEGAPASISEFVAAANSSSPREALLGKSSSQIGQEWDDISRWSGPDAKVVAGALREELKRRASTGNDLDAATEVAFINMSAAKNKADLARDALKKNPKSEKNRQELLAAERERATAEREAEAAHERSKQGAKPASPKK